MSSGELSDGNEALMAATEKVGEMAHKVQELMCLYQAVCADRDRMISMLDAAYPIIEAARLVRARYSGDLTGVPRALRESMKGFDGVPKVCPDQTGVLIEALNNMESTCNFAPVPDGVTDGND